jgi:hypothetical protein
MRQPRADLCLEADVVVRELAHFGVIDAEDFGFGRAAETGPGCEVEDPEDDGL